MFDHGYVWKEYNRAKTTLILRRLKWFKLGKIVVKNYKTMGIIFQLLNDKIVKFNLPIFTT